jgi:hypothetical protein
MPVQIQHQSNDTYVLRISGILKRSEFGAEERALASQIDTFIEALLARDS